jgi:hypothetical protein
MRLHPLAFVPVLATSLLALHCGPTYTAPHQDDAGLAADSGPVAPDGGDGGLLPERNPDAVGATTASKVDLLLVVDNSGSMGDKARLLSTSVGTLLRRLAPVGDLHVGVITSSLGTLGGDVCADEAPSNALAHLRTTAFGAPVPAAANGFLAYGGGAPKDIEALVAATGELVGGTASETGCGLEAQLESAYRFLVQPDPWAKITLDSFSQAQYSGIDGVLLAQRKAFLRPDSLVVVLMLTDEDDSSPDPRAVGGQGWAFSANQFQGSPIFRADGKTTTAPRATSACATNPGSPDCTSCGFAALCDASTATCQKIKNDPECQKNGGYYGPDEDSINTRYHRMKQRFGIDPQFPIARYVEGFTKQLVPNRDGEHTVTARADGKGSDVSAYLGDAKCTNPLFAAVLPGRPEDDTCNLPKGPRGKELVVFALIGGVPEQLATPTPDWTKILGANPATFDATGIDPHMIQAMAPRAGLQAPSATRGDNGTDPVHGREWDTRGGDLQYACTFELSTPRTCLPTNPGCDCGADGLNPPLCGTSGDQQLRGKSYPTVRELRVAHDLGDRGVIGSICPSSPSLGYAGAMAAVADRVAPRLTK